MRTTANSIFTREKILIIIILVLGFIWRVAYYNDIKSSPYHAELSVDAKYHHEQAVKIANGNFSMGNKAFFRAPLYIFFLGGIYKIFGVNLSAVIFIQFLIGLCGSFLLFLITNKLFNKTVGIIALFISCFYGMFIYMEREMLLESLSIFFTLSGIYLFLTALEKNGKLWFIFAGIIFGVAAITRPNILLFLVCIPFIMLAYFKEGGWFDSLKKNFSSIFIKTSMVAIGCILAILPVTIANYKAEKDFVLIASQGGLSFYIGNNINSIPNGNSAEIGNNWKTLSSDLESIPEKELGRKHLKSSEVSDFWFNKGVTFIRENPSAFIVQTLQKIYWFWNAFEISDNQVIDSVTKYSKIWNFTFKFWLICPLSFAGIFLAFRNKKKIVLPAVYILVYMVSVVIFYVGSRFRLPVVPFLIVFTSYFVYEVYNILLKKEKQDAKIKKKVKTAERKDYKPVLIGSLIFIVVAILIKPLDSKGTNKSIGFYFEGRAFENKNDFEQAVSNYRKAIEMNPQNPMPYERLAYIYALHYGDYKEAISLYKKAIESNPKNYANYENLGNCYKQINNYALAEKSYLESININDTVANVYFNLGQIYNSTKKYEEAIKVYQKAIELNPNDYEAYGQLGRNYILAQDINAAKIALEASLKINPSYGYAKKLLNEISNMKL